MSGTNPIVEGYHSNAPYAFETTNYWTGYPQLISVDGDVTEGDNPLIIVAVEQTSNSRMQYEIEGIGTFEYEPGTAKYKGSIGLSADEARHLAEALTTFADLLERKEGFRDREAVA